MPTPLSDYDGGTAEGALENASFVLADEFIEGSLALADSSRRFQALLNFLSGIGAGAGMHFNQRGNGVPSLSYMPPSSRQGERMSNGVQS